MIDSLENLVDYSLRILEDTNDWMKEHDPFAFPAVESKTILKCHDDDNGNKVCAYIEIPDNGPPKDYKKPKEVGAYLEIDF